MLALQVNDKPVECPVCWEETKVRIFQRLVSECETGDDEVKIFGILTGLQYSAIYESESELIEAELYRAVAFVLNQPQEFRNAPMPKSIRIGNVVVLIPTKIHKMTVGQNLHLRAAMMKAKNLESLLSIACAIYLQPLVDGTKFDFDRAKELEKAILEMNIFDVFPIGFFFLSKLNNYGRHGLLDWLLRKLLLPSKTLSMQLKQRFLNSKPFTISLSLTSTLIVTACLLSQYKSCRLTSSYRSFCYGKNVTSLPHGLKLSGQHLNPKTSNAITIS